MIAHIYPSVLQAVSGRAMQGAWRRVFCVVSAMVNVRGIPYVISDSMPPTSEVSDEQSRAYRKEEERRGRESGPWSCRPTAAGRQSERQLSRPGRRR
jgi:hypothetical protein